MTKWTFGAVGFILGVLISGTLVHAFWNPEESAPSLDARLQRRKVEVGEIRKVPQRIILQAVKSEELPTAAQTMGVDQDGQLLVRQDVAAGRYRLLWLTLWDWDAQNDDDGDTISINSGEYRRALKLHNRRHQIAIPEPKSGYIELRGVASGDGIIAVSLLSGAQPIALPRMVRGEAARIEIDAP